MTVPRRCIWEHTTVMGLHQVGLAETARLEDFDAQESKPVIEEDEKIYILQFVSLNERSPCIAVDRVGRMLVVLYDFTGHKGLGICTMLHLLSYRERSRGHLTT